LIKKGSSLEKKQKSKTKGIYICGMILFIEKELSQNYIFLRNIKSKKMLQFIAK